MPTESVPFNVIFPEWYDARLEHETPSKGYLADVVVRLENGSGYRLYFIDLVRLGQNLEDDTRVGRSYYAEPGLVVLREVTTEAIRDAVAGLYRDGFFRHLKPSPESAA
jgi:hypothetical protein